MSILNEISSLIDEDQELCKKGMQADYEALTLVREKISNQSSRYYELVPQARYKDSIAPPLNNQHMLKQAFENLDNLSNIERASKMLLGALFRQKEMHPIDYLHKALNIDMSFLNPNTNEYAALFKYIENTHQGSINFKTLKINFFKIERKGEAENYQDYLSAGNHRLLYHGS
jgi:hypothetical protein